MIIVTIISAPPPVNRGHGCSDSENIAWRAPAGKAAEYRRFLVERAIPDYQSVEGCLGVQIFERVEGGVAHFLVVSYWEDMEAVKRFAGPQPEKAKYYDEDMDYLLEFEPYARHYVIAADTYGGDSPRYIIGGRLLSPSSSRRYQ